MGAAEKGLIIKRPSDLTQLDMECFVDADFCGLWGKEERNDPTSVKSRAGFIIKVAGCPIIWSSKLQQEISLSTMMSEYYALSSSMREVLPMQRLVEAVAEAVGLNEDNKTTFKTTVWEDNNGALTLAQLPPGQNTSRSKHYDVKTHWFRSHLKPNKVVVRKVDTKLQQADIFTKALKTEDFQRLRKLMMGW